MSREDEKLERHQQRRHAQTSREKIKLPKRSSAGKSDDNASLKNRRFVAERY